MLVKYVVGLTLVLACCIVPLVIEQWQPRADPNSDHFAAVIMAWFPFIWAVQFGFGFASGALIGRTGPAIMVALALSLLAYLLPLILPPLHALSVPEVLFNATAAGHLGSTRQVPIVMGAILLSAGGLILAVLAVCREWRIRSSQKMMYWSVALAFLLALASATFQLATNLPILQTLDPGPSHHIFSITSDGQHGILMEKFDGGKPGIRTLDLTNGELRLGPDIDLAGWAFRGSRFEAWLPQHPAYLFVLRYGEPVPHAGGVDLELGIVKLQASSKPEVLTLRLATVPNSTHTPSPSLQSVGDRLYAMWWKDDQTPQAVTIEVTDPAHPRIIPCAPYTEGFLFGYPPAPVLQFEGVPALGVSAVDSERAALRSYGFAAALCSPDVLATEGGQLTIYKLKSFAQPTGMLTKRLYGLRPQPVFEFQKVGQYEPTMLERVLRGWVEQIAPGRSSTVYVRESEGPRQSLQRTTVFDVANPAHPRVIGHFVAPEDRVTICPLPDGRALAGGRKLYLLGPPPRR
jgi:hypothetical protein